VSRNGYRLVKDSSSNTFTLPFGGDSSNNLPTDNSGGIIPLNSSSWLKITLDASQIDIPKNVLGNPETEFYIPIYWHK
jgi:hypothetical protein